MPPLPLLSGFLAAGSTGGGGDCPNPPRIPCPSAGAGVPAAVPGRRGRDDPRYPWARTSSLSLLGPEATLSLAIRKRLRIASKQ